jgi:hypothetical protein
VINRSYIWIDEVVEHGDLDTARAKALASRWSAIKSQIEEAGFRSQFDAEEGRDYDPFEDCECEYCLRANHDCDCDGPSTAEDPGGSCSLCATQTELTECESQAEWRQSREEARAERDLEIELIEDKLAAIGARMARPYEHFNEDETYMQYMEEGRFGECSY